jgi:hypothetical protein
MRKVLSTSEIVQDLDHETEPKQLCAAAEAEYDDRNSTLVVQLDAFVRQVHHAGPDAVSRPNWLPKGETLREGVSSDEASTLARDIFRRWTKKVRESVVAERPNSTPPPSLPSWPSPYCKSL